MPTPLSLRLLKRPCALALLSATATDPSIEALYPRGGLAPRSRSIATPSRSDRICLWGLLPWTDLTSRPKASSPDYPSRWSHHAASLGAQVEGFGMVGSGMEKMPALLLHLDQVPEGSGALDRLAARWSELLRPALGSLSDLCSTAERPRSYSDLLSPVLSLTYLGNATIIERFEQSFGNDPFRENRAALSDFLEEAGLSDRLLALFEAQELDASATKLFIASGSSRSPCL